ncbi:MAG: hypothetical protein GXO26_05215 [Crenarchaeota archaeon]|nr:hypothetical protein [Thermoproteota archaeon]
MRQDSLIEKTIRYLFERGFTIIRLRRDLVKAVHRSLRVSVWFSDKDYLDWYDPLNLIDEFQLNDVQSLIIVAPRAYSIADEVLHSLDRARYWYDLFIDVKIYSVDIAMLDKALEEAVNSLLTTFIDLAMNIVEDGGRCPRCLSNMYVLYLWKFNSKILKDKVIEKVYRCPNCGLRIHRTMKIEDYLESLRT